jgi:FkbM family methyltransferase
MKVFMETSVSHHPVFAHFQPFRGEVRAFTIPDFLGTMYRDEFTAGWGRGQPIPYQAYGSYPEFKEDYFEWIDILEAAVAARGSFTMIDLGAGFGRWSVGAAFAIRQCHPDLPFKIVAVEAEPTVFEWMRLNFADNGIDPGSYKLIHAAVTEHPGDVLFYIGGPSGGPYDKHPNAWYGQFLTQDYDMAGDSAEDGEYGGRRVLRHASGWRSIRVPGISLRRILQDLDVVDVIDMDIEGQELPAIQASIGALDAKVRRLHIGTHSKEIEAALRELLSRHGWRCWADYTQFSTSDTPFGPIAFENGVQSWTNPRLA